MKGDVWSKWVKTSHNQQPQRFAHHFAESPRILWRNPIGGVKDYLTLKRWRCKERERRGEQRSREGRERRCRASGCRVSRQYSWSICLPSPRRQPAATTRWQTPLKEKYFPATCFLPPMQPFSSTSMFESSSPSPLYHLLPLFSSLSLLLSLNPSMLSLLRGNLITLLLLHSLGISPSPSLFHKKN